MRSHEHTTQFTSSNFSTSSNFRSFKLPLDENSCYRKILRANISMRNKKKLAQERPMLFPIDRARNSDIHTEFKAMTGFKYLSWYLNMRDREIVLVL